MALGHALQHRRCGHRHRRRRAGGFHEPGRRGVDRLDPGRGGGQAVGRGLRHRQRGRPGGPPRARSIGSCREGVAVGLANHTVVIARDGTETAIEDSAAPIKDASGGIIGVVLVFRDATEQRRHEAALRESEGRHRAILESITDGFFAVSRDWRFTYVNPQGERILDRKPGELLGRSLWEEYPGLAGSEFERSYHRARRRGGRRLVHVVLPGPRPLVRCPHLPGEGRPVGLLPGCHRAEA